MTNPLKLTLLLLLVANGVCAQIRFSHVLGNNGYDDGYSAKQTFDKGYIIGGSTSSYGAGANDMYLLKTNPYGIPTRQNTYGGINIDVGKCARQTADSGYVIVGYTNSFGNGGYDIYLVKTDSLLDTLWTKTYGGTNWDFGNCIEQTTDGGYIICGYTYSYGNGDADYYILKTNALGDTMWTKTFGGTREDIANSIIQTTDGGYIVTGTTKSMGDTLGDFYTIKLTANGDTSWTNKFGGSYLDYGNDILESRYGGYIVAGETQSFSYVVGSSDGILEKVSPTGQTDSSYSTGFSSPLFDNLESVTEDTMGRLAMVGRDNDFGNGDVHFFMIDKGWHNFTFATTFGGTGIETGYSVECTADNGFIVCGVTNSFNNLLDDVYLVKTDSTGHGGNSDVVIITNVETYSISSNSEMKIYPNPATNVVTIYSEKINEFGSVKVYDIIGNEVKNEKLSKQSTSFNLGNLADGMYIVTFTNGTNSFSKKLIVQH